MRRQVAVQQQVDDLFVRRVAREIVDVVSTVGQPADFAFNIAENRLADDDAFQTTIDHCSCHNAANFKGLSVPPPSPRHEPIAPV